MTEFVFWGELSLECQTTTSAYNTASLKSFIAVTEAVSLLDACSVAN